MNEQMYALINLMNELNLLQSDLNGLEYQMF